MATYEYQYWGMHLIWWIIWVSLIFWIFATPYNIPGQRLKYGSALHLLRNQYAEGKITKEEYQERKKILSAN